METLGQRTGDVGLPLGCQISSGRGGRIAPGSVAGFGRNEWPVSAGLLAFHPDLGIHHPSQTPTTVAVPPTSRAMNVPIPETVIGTPATAVWVVDGVVTVSVPDSAVTVRVEAMPDAVPQTAVVWVVTTVSWMWAATHAASVAGHCHEPATPSWKPRKCATRHEATASVGDHEVPAAAEATSCSNEGRANCSTSALATSWATRASDGAPLNTVCSTPADHEVQPAPPPALEVTPQGAEVSPMLQLQDDEGAMPEFSTSATTAATDGGTAPAVGVVGATPVDGVGEAAAATVGAEALAGAGVAVA